MFEEIQIIDGKTRASIFIRNNNVYVCSNNNSFDVEKYFDILRQYSPKELERMSRNAIVYDGKNGKKETKNKILKILGVTYFITLIAACLIASSRPHNYRIRNLSSKTTQIKNYSVDDIKQLIYSSPYLSAEEKEFFFNKDLISDVLDTINYDNQLKYNFAKCFTDIKILNFVDEGTSQEGEEEVFGYYESDLPSTIFIKNYVRLIEDIKDTLAHEFIHLCQDVRGYNLLIEATAEIISYEYFDMPMYNYSKQVKLVKKLMEIIGPQPVWNYVFTGDFSEIEASIKPYLSEEDYESFLEYLTFDYDDSNANIPGFHLLGRLLEKVYKAKYNDDMRNNKVISLIDDEDAKYKRYYFNKRKINKKNSYYYDFEQGEYKIVDLATAIDAGVVDITAVCKIDIEPEEAITLLRLGVNSIVRSIDYSSAKIVTTGIMYENNHMYFSGRIDGEKYENADVDELVEKGIIKVEYFIYDERILSAEEFFESKQQDDGLVIAVRCWGQSTLVGDKVFGKIPKKVYLPTIDERIEEAPQEEAKEEDLPEETQMEDLKMSEDELIEPFEKETPGPTLNLTPLKV